MAEPLRSGPSGRSSATAASQPSAPSPVAPDAVTRVTVLGPASRVALRIAGAETEPAGTVAGFDLSGPINSVRGTADRFAARLGPDEWLLVGPHGDDIAGTVAAALGDRFHAAVDVSDRNVAMTVEGPSAREVLNGGIALDLDDRAFPAGTATRTLLGKAEVVLVRAAGAEAFRIECWRSFGPYVEGFLREVAREFG